MVRQAVSNEAAGPAHGHTTSTRRKSSVWRDFDYVHVPGATAMATCKRCGSTFHASSKKHGTSALRRHARSPCCAKRAAQRAGPCLPAAAPAPDDDEEEETLAKRAAQREGPCLPAAAAPAGDDDVEWRAMVKSIEDLLMYPGYDAGLFSREEQQDGGLTTANSPFTDGDHHGYSPNHCMPDTHMPQAHSSSSRRFFRKKRERSANSASHQGETTDKGHSAVYTDFTFGDAYDFDS